MLGTFEVNNRFSYHSPTPAKVEDHQDVRELLKNAAHTFDVMLPEGREKSLAITKLEEAMFWANAAIARNE